MERTVSTFAVLHTPVTSAPNAFAICTANVPTPPDAPLMRTFWPGLDLAVIPKQLESGAGRHADGCRLLEGEIGRLADELILRCAGELGKGARAPTEDLVPGPEGVDLRTDRLDRPRDVGSRNTVLWLGQPGAHAHDVRHSRHQDPVTDVDGGRMDANEHIVLADLGLADILCGQDLRGAVLVLDDRLHCGAPSCAVLVTWTLYAAFVYAVHPTAYDVRVSSG